MSTIDYLQRSWDNLEPWLRPRLVLSKWEARTFLWGLLMVITSWLPIWGILGLASVRGLELGWGHPIIAMVSMCLVPAIARFILKYLCFGTVPDDRGKSGQKIWVYMSERVDETFGWSIFPLFPTAGFLIVIRFLVIIPLRILQKPLIIGKPWKAFRLNAPCLLFVPDWVNRSGQHWCRDWKKEFHPFFPMKDEKYDHLGRWQSLEG